MDESDVCDEEGDSVELPLVVGCEVRLPVDDGEVGCSGGRNRERCREKSNAGGR